VSITCSNWCSGSLPGRQGFPEPGYSSNRKATSGASLKMQATAESVGKNTGGARVSKV